MTAGKKLSGQKKAAALLAALGPETAAAVLKELKSQKEIDRVAYELSNLGALPEEVTREVLTESYQHITGGGGKVSGGLDMTRDILRRAMGEQRAAAVISRAEAGMAKKYTFSGSVYFERMKAQGTYSTDVAAIQRRVAQAGLTDIFAKPV